MAERSSLIVEIDRWVMQQSLALIREHLQENQLLRLYVAQSPLTLAAPGQAEWLRRRSPSAGVPGRGAGGGAAPGRRGRARQHRAPVLRDHGRAQRAVLPEPVRGRQPGRGTGATSCR
jgi:hypothetical protein